MLHHQQSQFSHSRAATSQLNVIFPTRLCCSKQQVESNTQQRHVAEVTSQSTGLTALWACRYWVRYLVGIWIELPLYAVKARRWGMVCQCLTMEALYIALVVALSYLNTAATVWTLLVPLMITSFALMLGNWYTVSPHVMPLHPAMLYSYPFLQPASRQTYCI